MLHLGRGFFLGKNIPWNLIFPSKTKTSLKNSFWTYSTKIINFPPLHCNHKESNKKIDFIFIIICMFLELCFKSKYLQVDLATQLGLLCSVCGLQTIFSTSSFSEENPPNYSVNKIFLPNLGPSAYYSLVNLVQKSMGSVKVSWTVWSQVYSIFILICQVK